jgi:hypothetical protein
MVSKIRMLTERAYSDGVADATAEILGILRTSLMLSEDRSIVNAVTAFVVGTETVINTGSAQKAVEAYDNVRSLDQ